MMGDDEKSIFEAIEEEVAEAAKAVVADVKSIAAEVADAIIEGKVGSCEAPQPVSPPAEIGEATSSANSDNLTGVGPDSAKARRDDER